MLRLLLRSLWIILLGTAFAAAEEVSPLALTKILGEEVLQQNHRQLLQDALTRPESERFAMLQEWVLPSTGHSEFRLACEYDSNPRLQARPSGSAPPQGGAGGYLVSPVLHLVQLADRLGRLDELQLRVEASRASTEVAERCRIALLTLIEMHRGRFPEARKWMTDLERRHFQQTFASPEDRSPETLVLTQAVQHVELHEIAESMLTRALSEQVRKGHHCGPPAWDRHMAALLGTLRQQQLAQASPAPSNIPLSEFRDWIPVAGCDEATRAMAMPALVWQRTGDQVEKVIGHQDDFLMFRSPLRGDFTIECETSCFDYREMQLVIGGDWFAPHYTLDVLETGTLRGMTAQRPLTPKLSLVSDWTRQRAVIHDGICTHFFNGRLMQTRPQRPHQFPWVAFRSPFFANGRVRDVRMTGTPEIPETISLSSDPDLSGWGRFHLDDIGGPFPDWEYKPAEDSAGEIRGYRKTRFQHTFQESLLRYIRPMAEDGTIEYEFFYAENTEHVHPALDQLVFLLEPKQVALHQATTGIHDRTGLNPLNRQEVSPAVACSLLPGWNRLKLEVIGDLVRIVLNGTPVYDGNIPADNDRTFGLFHYADQTSVRVRHVNWTGNWPKVLPPTTDQELRSPALDDLEARVRKLNNRIDFDFVTKSSRGNPPGPATYSEKLFQFQTSDQRGTAKLTTSGLEMTRPGTAEFSDVWVTPRIRIIGDFEIEAAFEDLKLATPTNGTNSINLIVVTEDTQTTHSRIWHGAYAHPNIELRHATQTEFNRYGKNRGVSIDFQGVTSEECASGRSRIVRLGQRMHFLIAEQDSQFFRLIHMADVTNAPVRFDGIRLGAGIWGSPDGSSQAVSVRWKNLKIRTAPNGTQRMAQ
jgi:hypothetical protein